MNISFPKAIEFTLLKGVKKFTIGQQIMNKSEDKLFEEIKGCELYCANCHREISFGEGKLDKSN